MRQRGTLASAIVVVLLTGIVSAGAKTGVLSIDKTATPATVALESANATADGGQSQPGQSGKGKSSKFKGSGTSAGGRRG